MEICITEKQPSTSTGSIIEQCNSRSKERPSSSQGQGHDDSDNSVDLSKSEEAMHALDSCNAVLVPDKESLPSYSRRGKAHAEKKSQPVDSDGLMAKDLRALADYTAMADDKDTISAIAANDPSHRD